MSSLPEVMTPEVPRSRLTGNQLFKVRLSYISEVLGEIHPEFNSSHLVTVALRILFTDAHIKTVSLQGNPFVLSLYFPSLTLCTCVVFTTVLFIFTAPDHILLFI
jgi:hypothetical protein